MSKPYFISFKKRIIIIHVFQFIDQIRIRVMYVCVNVSAKSIYDNWFRM